jgi:membrane-associated phospholipid phosphatase
MFSIRFLPEKHSLVNKNKFLLCSTLYLTVLVSATIGQSPYKCDWAKDGLIIGSGAVIGSAAYAIDHSQSVLTLGEINQLSSKSINWFDKGAVYQFSEEAAKVSDIAVGLSIAAPFVLLSDHKMRKDWSTFSIMYFETVLFSVSVPSIGKGSVKRIRPFVYNHDVPIEKKTSGEAKRSFFSRHTTIAFASAVFLSTVYNNSYPDSKWTPYVWTGSLLAAGAVGYFRYEAGEHFPTDIITGAVVGSAIGYFIPHLHQINNENDKISMTLTIFPPGIGIQIKL